MRDFYLRSRRMIDREVQAHGVSYARTKMLQFLVDQGDARAIDVASAFGFAPRTVTEALDALERDGLVVREADAKDRRVKRLLVTEAGHAAVAEARPARERLVANLFAALAPDEQAHMAELMERLNTRLSDLERRGVALEEGD